MKPYPFRYVRAGSLDDLYAHLAEYGDGAQILAGGQSLVPVLAMRLAQPEVLVDINGIGALKGISLEGDSVRIGALVRHVEVLKSEVVRTHLPLVAEAMPHVAHVAVRNRGTIGGSLALADPAAELPACAVALEATIVLRSSTGERRVKAGDFFRGLYETDRRPGEVLAEVRFPKAKPGYHGAFLELARRRGDFALVGVAAWGRVERGAFSDLSLVYFGCEGHAKLSRRAAAAAMAGPYGADAFGAVTEALADELDPMANMHGSRETKLHLAQVLTGRALQALLAKAKAAHG